MPASHDVLSVNRNSLIIRSEDIIADCAGGLFAAILSPTAPRMWDWRLQHVCYSLFVSSTLADHISD